MGLTDNDFPVLGGGCHLVGAPRLRIANASHDKDDEPGNVAHVLLRLVLVPMTITSATIRMNIFFLKTEFPKDRK